MIIGGQSFVSCRPAFSNDAKKLLVCTGCTVSVFSTSTGMLVTELEGHTDLVTSIVVVPVTGPASKVMCFCWTSSLDGTICYWDFVAAELVRKVKVQLPIFSMVIPHISHVLIEGKGKTSDLYAFVSVEDVSKPSDQQKALRGQIQMYNLTNSRRTGGLLAETRSPELIIVSNSGEFIGIQNKQRLHIWRIPGKDLKYDEIKKIKLHHTKKLTVLAFHPTERMVAGGDITGRILIWRDFGKREFSEMSHTIAGDKFIREEERPGVRGNDDADSCSTWHWHPSAVKLLSFSSDGAYLYSGGNEGVLVIWQLDSGKKKFKPRLGSRLLYFTESPDPSLSCVSLADNWIRLLKMPSSEIIKSISGIKFPFSSPIGYEGSYGGFAFDHTSGLVAVRTENYCVQFFSLFDNLEVSQVQVCERNHQPVDDITVFVALVAISADGSMMATVEVKLFEEGIGGHVNLKFWTRGSCPGEYTLSTVIYEPHSDAGISAIAFRPNHGMAVTSSFGGDFKAWVHSSFFYQKDQMVQKHGWKCQLVGSYKKKPMTAAAFSADGSVLAVAAENIVTLWDPDTNALVAVIGDELEPMVALSFVGKSEYLVSVSQGSKSQLAVWNLSNLSLHWSYKLFVEAVACAGCSSHFAILALPCSPNDTAMRDGEGLILLFQAEDPVPVATWSVKKAKGGGLAFLPPNPSLSDPQITEGKDPLFLAFINCEHEFIVFDPQDNECHQIKKQSCQNRVPHEETEQFGYASIYGELPEFDSKDQIPEIPFVPSAKPWETIFSGSSHVLPPLPKLCSMFLESLLEKTPVVDE